MGRPKDFAEADSTRDSDKADSTGDRTNTQFQWQAGPGRLYRDESNKILGGVCSGIGNYLRIDPWIVRILFIVSGIGLLAYIILWIFIPSNLYKYHGPVRKLYRNPDDKVIAGVCGGIGSYFNISSWIPRILFLLPLLSFMLQFGDGWMFFPRFASIGISPGFLLLYIILWAVIPEAKTTSEKLEMKGEKIDVDSIKESVSREMKEVAERLEKMGKDAGAYMKEKGPQVRQEFASAANRSGSVLGNIIITIFKIFVYIIVGAIVFAIIISVLALALVAIGLFPLKSFLVSGTWQNFLVWSTLIFLVIIPTIGLIVFLIRKLARRKNNSYYRNIVWGSWVFGLICALALSYYVSNDFRYSAIADEGKIELTNTSPTYLEIKPLKPKDYTWRRWLTWEPYSTFGVQDDTAYLYNVDIRVLKSNNNQYSVEYIKISNGHSREEANELASKIQFNAISEDSVLYLDNMIPVNTHDKFRNQMVAVSIYVPVNHRIKINKDFSSLYTPGFQMFRPGMYNFRSEGYYAFPGREYVMTEDGLKKITNDDNDDDTYRYNGSSIIIDSIRLQQRKQINDMERSLDSTKEVHKREIQRMQDSLRRKQKEIERELQKLDMQSSASLPLPSGWAALPQGFFFYI